MAHRTNPAHADGPCDQHGLEDIVAAASYELRQPLQSILGWVRLAQSSMAGADTLRRALASIERGAQLVSGIADDLLASTPFVDRGVRALACVDIAVLVDETVESARPSALAASVGLVATRPPGVVMVRGDRAGLQHVTHNLLANAIRATPPNGLVDVHVTARSRWRTSPFATPATAWCPSSCRITDPNPASAFRNPQCLQSRHGEDEGSAHVTARCCRLARCMRTNATTKSTKPRRRTLGVCTKTILSGLAIGSGFSTSAFTTLKTSVLAPIPNASDRIATTAKPGLRRAFAARTGDRRVRRETSGS